MRIVGFARADSGYQTSVGRNYSFCVTCCAIYFSLCMSSAAFAADRLPAVSQRFVTDGSFIFDPKYEGAILRIIAIGGGGGGSRAASSASAARVGAGGGSGSVTYQEVVISGSRTVTWVVGKGGSGGALSGLGHGAAGGVTRVELSFGPSTYAEGGEGGVYVSSDSAAKKSAASARPAPSMGGLGGLPRGVRGDDGQLDYRFNGLGQIHGGKGGKLRIDAGAGGNGGGAFARRLPNQNGLRLEAEAGATGQDGAVLLQVGLALPQFLAAAEVDGPSVKSDAAFAALLTNLSSQCDKLKAECPEELASTLRRVSSEEMSFSQKAVLLFSSRSLLAEFIREVISKAVPLTRAALLLEVLTPAVLDGPTVEPSPIPLKESFKEMTGQDLDELAAMHDAAADFIKATRPDTPATQASVDFVKAYAATMRKEILARQQRGISYYQTPVDYYGDSVRTPKPARGGAWPAGGADDGARDRIRERDRIDRQRRNQDRLRQIIREKGQQPRRGSCGVCENNRCVVFPC